MLSSSRSSYRSTSFVLLLFSLLLFCSSFPPFSFSPVHRSLFRLIFNFLLPPFISCFRLAQVFFWSPTTADSPLLLLPPPLLSQYIISSSDTRPIYRLSIISFFSAGRLPGARQSPKPNDSTPKREKGTDHPRIGALWLIIAVSV